MANPLPMTPNSRQQFALLPPLQLYRRLLKVHRKKLPKDMRLLGDEYVKSEFRAHRNVDNPIHIVSRTPTPRFAFFKQRLTHSPNRLAS